MTLVTMVCGCSADNAGDVGDEDDAGMNRNFTQAQPRPLAAEPLTPSPASRRHGAGADRPDPGAPQASAGLSPSQKTGLEAHGQRTDAGHHRRVLQGGLQ